MDSVIVRGPWMGAIWSDVAVTLPRRPALPDFLERSPMPPLLADEAYARHYPADVDRVLHWMIALLHHPDESVVLAVVRFWELSWSRYVRTEVSMPYRTLLFDSAADHLLSSNEDLASAAARLFWRGYSDSNWAQVMSILGDPLFPDKNRALQRLQQHRPEEHELLAQAARGDEQLDRVEAAFAGKTATVKQLVESGVNVESKDSDGYTALIWAAANGDGETVKFLLAKGANIDAKNNTGETALMWAALEGKIETVRLLLDNGADPKAANSQGDTALIWAQARGHSDIVTILSAVR